MRKVFYILPLLLLTLCISGNDVFAQPGMPETGFATDGTTFTDLGAGAVDQVNGMAVQGDGKVVVAGYGSNGTNLDFMVARYNADGTLDNSFNLTGFAITDVSAGNDDGAFVVAIQSDGKIVVGGVSNNGSDFDFAVVRYNADGTLDPTFSGDGIVTTDITGAGSGDNLVAGIAIQSDGKIIISGQRAAGSNGDFALVRYNADGTLDTSFDTDGIVTANSGGTLEDFIGAIALQSDGKIVLAGYNEANANDFVVMRFNTDGSPDITFDTDGVVTTDIGTTSDDKAFSVAIQADGKILVGGYSNSAGSNDFAVLRYNTDGSLDLTFDTDGIALYDIGVTSDDKASAVAIQNDNKIVVSGESDANTDFNVIRLLTDGSLDATFGTAGMASIDINSGNTDVPTSMRLDHTRIYVAGFVDNGAGNFDFAVAALQNDASALPLNILSFTAQKQNNAVALSWTTEREEGITQFIVERSSDGRNFSPIGHLSPAKNNTLVKEYSFLDQQPLVAVNYYRLAVKELDESFTRSKILAIKFSQQAITSLEVFPNPVTNNSLRMQMPDGLNGRVNVQVLDATGRIVKRISLQANGGSSIATSLDVSSLQKGIYFIKLESTGTVITKRFLKN